MNQVWFQDYRTRLLMSFPTLSTYIYQALDMGNEEQMLEFLMALEYEGRLDA